MRTTQRNHQGQRGFPESQLDKSQLDKGWAHPWSAGPVQLSAQARTGAVALCSAPVYATVFFFVRYHTAYTTVFFATKCLSHRSAAGHLRKIWAALLRVYTRAPAECAA